jgi:hypothetical protein
MPLLQRHMGSRARVQGQIKGVEITIFGVYTNNFIAVGWIKPSDSPEFARELRMRQLDRVHAPDDDYQHFLMSGRVHSYETATNEIFYHMDLINRRRKLGITRTDLTSKFLGEAT